MLIARPLYYDCSYRKSLALLISDCLNWDIPIPDDMPVDTEDHVLAAIMFLSRRRRDWPRRG